MRIKIILAAAALSAGACSDPTTPDPGPLTDLVLDLCAGSDFTWVGYQNTGQPWQKVTPAADGSVSFQASEKVSVALVVDFFGSTITEVLNTTAAELESFATGGNCDAFGTRIINGTVANLTGEQTVDIYGAQSPAFASASFPDWQLTDLPNQGVIDLIATRSASLFTSPPDRVIVRRALTPDPSGAPIAALDFTTEGQPFESAVVTLNNAGTNGVAMIETAVQTANGTLATLAQMGGVGATQFSYVSLPASLRVATDMHVLWALASGPSDDREVYTHYRTPAAKTLTFGPALSQPTVAQVATSPYLRLRADLPSQTDYPDAASVEFVQSNGDLAFKLVTVTTTRAFLGSTPATWRLEIPDFGSTYEADWGLAAGSYNWGIAAVDGDVTVALGAPPSDGTTIRIGSRFSQTEQVLYSGLRGGRRGGPNGGLGIGLRGGPRGAR